MTIDELFQTCWSEHWNCERFTLSGHAPEVQSKYRLHIKPTFGDLDYLKVTRAQIRDWHHALQKTSITANRSLEILSKLYKFAQDKEWTEGYNPCQGVKHFVEKKRRRYASEREIKLIGSILERMHIQYPIEVCFLYCLMFTGSRPRAIERASWNDLTEIENDYGMLVFEGKSSGETGDLESVLLPPFIMEKIRLLPRRQDHLIFGIKSPTYLWRKIRTEAKCEDLWCRDLRRSFATIGMSGGVDMSIISQLLNHHSAQTTRRYALLNNDARLNAVGKITEKLNSILKK